MLSGNLGVGVSVKSSGVGSILNKGAPPIVATNTAQINQLSVHNQMSDPLEVSASAVDQLFQYQLENIVEEIEEQKIQHERAKREELKNMEQTKRNIKLKLQTDAEKDLDELRNKLELEKQASSQFTIEQRKVELQTNKEVRVGESRDH